MCGRVVWRWDAALEAWVKEYLREEAPEGSRPWLTRSRYNVAPTQPLPVAVRTPRLGRDILEVQWGVERPGGGLAINARMESMAGTMWRSLEPCLVPVSGFYEWSHAGPRPVPHFIQRADGEAMVLAGLWTGPGEGTGQGDGNGSGEGVGGAGSRAGARAAIVTCPPAGAVEKLHDRMPVVLGEKEWPRWLEERRLPEGAPDLVYHQVGAEVNRSDATGPGLVEPVRRWF